MLILTRKLGERIIIGDYIVVTLLEIKGAQAKIGIEAPKNITVHRHEIYERIKEENIGSSDVNDADLSEAISLLKTINPEREIKVED